MKSIDIKQEMPSQPSGKIIRASEHKVWQSADDRLDKANKILNSLEAEKAAALERAQTEGYRAGFEEGKNDVLNLAFQIQQAVGDRLQDVEGKLMELSRWVIEQTLAEIPEMDRIESIIRSQVGAIAAPVRATLIVPNDDVEKFRKMIASSETAVSRPVDVQGDDQLESGQVELVIGGMKIDASAEAISFNLHHDFVRAAAVQGS